MKKHFTLFLSTALAASLYSCGGTDTRTGEGQTAENQTTTENQAPVRLEQVWATDSVMRAPESVLFDQGRSVIYVANIGAVNKDSRDGDGFISRLSPDGQVQDLKWVTGLNDPKGMGLHNNVLYVTDLSQIVSINAETGAILRRFDVPGAQFLNDITTDASGNVYASDSDKRKIFQLSNNQVSEWISETKEERPNGLLKEDNRLISADFASGNIRFIDPQTKEYTDWASGIQGADGIVSDGQGGYFISSWHGEVHFVNEEGKNWNVLNTREEKINAADIEFMQQRNLLLVPTFFDNRVVAYRVQREQGM
jgi:outer membrane protein assembly factor BamB